MKNQTKNVLITLKKFSVDPLRTEPYLISVCLLKSSAFSIGFCIRWTVRNAAKLAVYDEIKIRVKKAHTQLIKRTDGARGLISVPRKILLRIQDKWI